MKMWLFNLTNVKKDNFNTYEILYVIYFYQFLYIRLVILKHIIFSIISAENDM